MPYDNKLPRVLISENCISHLKMRVFWLSGPNGWPDKKLKHKGNVAHSTFRGGCVIDLVWKNYSLYVKIAIFSYKLDTLYELLVTRLGAISNCQLPITLEVIANDPITNYFTKKVMGNAPNYPLLFGYISNWISSW